LCLGAQNNYFDSIEKLSKLLTSILQYSCSSSTVPCSINSSGIPVIVFCGIVVLAANSRIALPKPPFVTFFDCYNRFESFKIECNSFRPGLTNAKS
jgi:hypothetical protein